MDNEAAAGSAQIASNTADSAPVSDARPCSSARLVSQGELLCPDGFKWIGLRKLEYEDEGGVQRSWESVERTTRKGDIDGVEIVPVLVNGPSKRPETVLVSQFRPPVGDYVLEFPAGLVDAGESAEEAAVRELKEECGLVGRPFMVSPIVLEAPGMSNANMRSVYMRVDMSLPENINPVSENDDSECITTHRVFLDELESALLDTKKAFGRPMAVDARIFALAAGLNFQRTLDLANES